MQPQYDAEDYVHWHTDDGQPPTERPWVREVTTIHGQRQRLVRNLQSIAGVKTRSGEVVGCAVLDADAPNMRDAGLTDSPYGKARFTRRVFWYDSTDLNHLAADGGVPDGAVTITSIEAGEPAAPYSGVAGGD